VPQKRGNFAEFFGVPWAAARPSLVGIAFSLKSTKSKLLGRIVGISDK
jgi:hypothetical protein